MILLSELRSIAKYLFGLVAVLFAAFMYGKKVEKNKKFEEAFLDATKSKNRQKERRGDDIASVRKRMQNYLRK